MKLIAFPPINSHCSHRRPDKSSSSIRVIWLLLVVLPLFADVLVRGDKTPDIDLQCTSCSSITYHNKVMAWKTYRSTVHSPYQQNQQRRAFMIYFYFWGFIEHAAKQTVDMSVIWDAMTLMWRLCNVVQCIKSTSPKLMEISNNHIGTNWENSVLIFQNLPRRQFSPR